MSLKHVNGRGESESRSANGFLSLG